MKVKQKSLESQVQIPLIVHVTRQFTFEDDWQGNEAAKAKDTDKLHNEDKMFERSISVHL